MLEELNKISKVKSDIDLTQYNTYRIHAVGKYIIFPTSFDELINVLNIVKKYDYKHLILGNGSNISREDKKIYGDVNPNVEGVCSMMTRCRV